MSAYADDHADDYVGTNEGWTQPYERESVVYRAAPPFRYNRVEGLTLGIRRDPLSLGDPEETARIYGQVGYAFALRDLRYTIGLESKLIRDAETGLKVGASYQKQTLTPDRWKTSYAENSLGGIGFEYDFFDYYEAEGLSVYAVQALSHTLRLTAGFRAEEHRSLPINTEWSLFETGTFRANPQIDGGRLQAGFASLEGGRIQDHNDLPTGAAFRVAATLGTAFGGDLSANRYEVDGRAFLPLSTNTRLGLRLRGGYATSGAPRRILPTASRQTAANGVEGARNGKSYNEARSTTARMADLIVKAAVKDALDDMNVASDFYDALDGEVAELLDDAARRAQENDRKTVQPRDL